MTRVLLSYLVALLCFASPLLAQDVTPPTFTSCPGNVILQLAPGACEIIYNFNVNAIDNTPGCTPNIAQTDGTGYTSGSSFPIGTTNLTFVATDCSSNTATCNVSIHVIEYVPASNGLICDDNLHISIPSTCEMFLTPDAALEGNYGCYHNFFVNVENTGSNYIGYYYVGETITFSVTNILTGNTCWGNALIEDKSGPFISGCVDDTINCLQDLRPISEGGDVLEPSFQDCNDFDVSYIDMITLGQCSDTYTEQIMRIWTATDELGYQTTCTQMITIERTSLLSLDPVCPAEKIMECVPGIPANIQPSNTGYPTVVIDGVTYEITEGANAVCNVTASYSDLVIPKCGVGFRIIRTWSVMDWCLPVDFVNNPFTCVQTIQYNDTIAPVFNAPANMTVSANLAGCRARPIIPSVAVTDCSSYTVAIFTPSGNINGNGGQVPAPGLPFGTHTITVKVTDACGNSASKTFTITVNDNTKPNPVCDQFSVVALDDTGYGFANAISFDNGSTDNCCLDGFKAARMTDNCGIPANLTFRDMVEFCCSDVGSNVQVRMRVYDCHGNFNECMVNVEVQDKSGPSITCPPNVNLTCGQDYTNPTLVGQVETDPALVGPLDGFAMDNCGANLVLTQSDAGSIACGGGTLYRTYAATDPAGTISFCVQTITVVNNNPFTGNNIVFPADLTLNGCTAPTTPANTGVPTYPASNGCFNLVPGFTDMVFGLSPDGCQKILRKWTVIDWCQYDPNNPAAGGSWSKVQTIVIMDNNPPVFAACNSQTFCNFKADCSPLAPDLTVSATDLCTPANQITYTWTVDLNDDGVADPGWVTSGSGQNTTNNYPVGTHRISYNAIDGCGNIGYCNFVFAIDDCKKPTPICANGLVAVLMSTGMVPVNADLYIVGSTQDNCTPLSELSVSFSPNIADSIMIFTCDDLGVNPVQIWVTDEAGNADFCATTIEVQDNIGACTSPLIAMSGAISNEQNQGVENVQVQLNGGITSSTATATTGSYQFANLPIGMDYTVTPSLNNSPLNGVTTFDLLLINQHILGSVLLDSPYKLIAADANRSGAVTVSDIVELRKLILHVIDNLSNNTSWRFVDGSYAFPNPTNPFAQVFPEVCNINDLAPSSANVNFKAIKVGDVNGTAQAHSFAGSSEDRGNQDFSFRTADKTVKAGEQVTLDFSTNLAGMFGYQFTLSFDQTALRFEKLAPAAATSIENYGLSRISEGIITASWYQLAAPKNGEETTQFSMTFTAMKDGLVSQMANINSSYTLAESYEKGGTVRPVVLEFTSPNGSIISNQFELYQNIPNPFAEGTVIRFQLPEASSATLTIFNMEGKAVKTVSGEFTKGYHELKVERSELTGNGVFYYRLQTPGNTATMKMTLLN